MDSALYLFDGTTTDDMGEWSENLKTHKRVAKTTVAGTWEVSTVFLGTNHGFGDGPPVLFETMVFGPHVEFCERYETADEAREGHGRVVAWLRRKGWRLRFAGRVQARLDVLSNRIGRWLAGQMWDAYGERRQ